jgi:hypothetical protein
LLLRSAEIQPSFFCFPFGPSGPNPPTITPTCGHCALGWVVCMWSNSKVSKCSCCGFHYLAGSVNYARYHLAHEIKSPKVWPATNHLTPSLEKYIPCGLPTTSIRKDTSRLLTLLHPLHFHYRHHTFHTDLVHVHINPPNASRCYTLAWTFVLPSACIPPLFVCFCFIFCTFRRIDSLHLRTVQCTRNS